MINNVKEAKRMMGMLKEARAPYLEACREIARYTLPKRGAFADSNKAGDLIDHKTLLDSDVEGDINDLAGGMMNGLTNPSLTWFELEVEGRPKLLREEKEWINDFKEVIERIMQQSNYYQTLHSVYKEQAVFGTGCFFMAEDFDSVINCEFLTFGRYFLGLGKNGKIEIFGREIKKTVYDLVKTFGLEKLPHTVKTAYKRNQWTQGFELYHIIFPNDDYTPGSKSAYKMKYRSCYYMDNMDEFISVGGYDYWAVISPRWELTDSSEAYGYGPGWFILGDVKQLQKMQFDKLKAIGKKVSPPLVLNSNFNGPVDVSENGVNVANGQIDASIKPLYMVDAEIKEIEYAIQQTKESIRRKLYADLFRVFTPENVGKMLATEISARLNERMQKMGPVLRVNETELLNPSIENIAYIAQKNKLIRPAPQSLQGLNIRIKYVSIIAQAQRASGVNAYRETLYELGEASKILPSIIQKIDGDKYADILADKLGTGLLLKDQEIVDEERAAEAESALRAEQAAGAAAVIQGVKTAGDIKLGQNSALDAVLTQAGGGGYA